MPGSLNLFDGQDLTALSESSARTRGINTLQIHHATTTSFSGLKSLMDPGGRTVSANGAMSNTGYLDEVVILSRRAFTSASSYDNQCLTVEVCNTTLGPEWGISHACRVRLAKLAVDMYRAGILGGLTRQFIIGHYEVPGTYATACPGPDMHLDAIVALAQQMYASGGGATAGGGSTPIEKEDELVKFVIYETGLTSPSGPLNGAVFSICPSGIKYYNDMTGVEAAASLYGGLNRVGDDTFSRLLDANGISWDNAMASRASHTFVRVG